MILRLTLLIVCAVSCIATSTAQDFSVENYSVEIFIDKEGYFDVVENYDVNFTYHKHGIYRDILTQYQLTTEEGTKEKRKIEISKIEVPGHRFEATGKFGQKIKNAVRIKIGDPNKTVIGPVHYEIKYRVKKAFLFEETFTQFYWNLKPPDWEAPFKKIDFIVHTPDAVRLDSSLVKVYAGAMGTTLESKDFQFSYNENSVHGSSSIGFRSNRGEALTILINLPPNSIVKHEPFWPFWTDYGWVLILCLLAGTFYWVFHTYGKDDPAPAVISYFPPDKMDPAMVGFLINDREDTSDLISLLPYWGNLGLIEIEEIDKKGWFAKDDTRIIKIANLPKDATPYEQTVFNGLFSGGETQVLVSSLKDSFYTTMSAAKGELKEAAQEYYDPLARKAYWFTGGGIILMLLIVLPLFFYFWGPVALVSALALGILLLILNRYMVKKNPKGIKLYSELKGFEKFIRTAEENRLKLLLKESPSYFESTMAYALSFGVFEQWARKFDSLDIPPPSWYHYAGTQMTMRHFSQSFSSTIKSTSSTMVSSPSSSGGGGSAGGGFDGGGGGSW